MFDALSAFHNETAQNNRIQIVKQRQLDCPELFSCKRLLSGWNDVFASKIKAPQERGGSTTCAIAIDVAEWQARHHEFITEVAKTTKQFVSMNLLTNVRKLIFMDLLFLRGCNVYHIHQLNSQPPSRSSPRAGIRAPNRDGNRGDDESLPGSRRASAWRKLDATAASDGIRKPRRRRRRPRFSCGCMPLLLKRHTRLGAQLSRRRHVRVVTSRWPHARIGSTHG